MSNLSHSMNLSELQSNTSIGNDIDSNFSSIMLEKEANDKEFIDICDKINSQIVETRDEIQLLMIRSSAFCASVGTKTESVVFPSKSPRHQINPSTISTPFSSSLSTPKSVKQNLSTPKKSNSINGTLL